MPGRRSPLKYNVHQAILQVLEDTNCLSGLTLDEICKVEPKYAQFFGLPSSSGHRRQVSTPKNKYKRKRRDNSKNYAAACFNFEVEVNQAAHPIVFEGFESFKAEDQEDLEKEITEEAKKNDFNQESPNPQSTQSP